METKTIDYAQVASSKECLRCGWQMYIKYSTKDTVNYKLGGSVFAGMKQVGYACHNCYLFDPVLVSY